MTSDKKLLGLGALIVLTGAALRLYRLDTLPPALFRDEAEKAYNAWSLLQNGYAVGSSMFPLFINVFGVTTSAIYQYFAVPFIAMFGLNEWGARLPAACIGIATLVSNFLFVKIERGKSTALWATAFLALSPWHIVFSRWAQQGIFLPFLVSTGLLFFALFLRRRRPTIIASAVCFGLAAYAYEIGRLFIPLFLLCLAVIYRKHLLRNRLWAMSGAGAFMIVIAPVIHLLLNQTEAAQARFRRISILQPESGASEVIFHFLENYSAHFSPRFLFLSGDSELRHSAGVGQLNWVEGAALLVGIIALLWRRKKSDKVMLCHLLLFPVAAALTREGIPHALRSIPALPVVQNIAAVGVIYFAGWFSGSRRRQVFQLAALGMLIGFIPFAKTYYSDYARRSAVNWQYGIKQLLAEAKASGASRIVVYNIAPGGEFLTAFYEKKTLGQLAMPRRGEPRFEFPQFNYPLDQLYARNASIPTAYLMLPHYPPPPGARVIAACRPGVNTGEAVCILYLNDKVRAAAPSFKPEL
jgi:4-amino-4-deoxy-L-arabinose transferase-like glycosyltransferase